MFIKFLDKQPCLKDESVFIAEGVKIIGDVTLDKNVNIWYNTIVRGDVAPIHIGENTNIQEGCTLHCSPDIPTTLGKNVTVGHNAILHGCTVEDNCLIGMGATILDGAIIGEGSIVGANALVTGNTSIPKHSLVLGSPAKVIKEVDYTQENLKHAIEYVELAQKYK